MKVTHSLIVNARCPANGNKDEYETTIEVARLIRTEEIATICGQYAEQKVWQEDLTRLLAQQFDATVTTVGLHGIVTTTVTVGN